MTKLLPLAKHKPEPHTITTLCNIIVAKRIRESMPRIVAIYDKPEKEKARDLYIVDVITAEELYRGTQNLVQGLAVRCTFKDKRRAPFVYKLITMALEREFVGVLRYEGDFQHFTNVISQPDARPHLWRTDKHIDIGGFAGGFGHRYVYGNATPEENDKALEVYQDFAAACPALMAKLNGI